MSERKWIWIGMAAMLAIGVALRVIHLFTMPFWLDEAYSAYAAGKGFRFLWQVVPYYETHPPFYYTLLAIWERGFGDSLISLRVSSLIASLATLPMMASCAGAIGRLLGRDDDGRRRLMFAAFAFGCVGVGLVEMAREVRPYALMILLYTCAIRALLGVRARRQAGRFSFGTAYAAYIVCVTLLLWLHNLGALWAAALGISLLIATVDRETDWRDIGWIIGGHALAVLLWLPALLILLDQAPTWVQSTWVRFSFAGALQSLAIIYAVPAGGGIAAIVLAGLGMAAVGRRGGRIAAMLVVLALVPAMLSIAISLAIAPVFITRTLTPAGVPALLLFAIGATARLRPFGWIPIGAALMLGTGMSVSGVYNRAEDESQRENWYGAIGWLRQHHRPGDLILAYPNEGALPLRRAMGDKGIRWSVRAVPAEVPAIGWGDWHPTGNRGVTSLRQPAIDRVVVDPAIRAAPTIWLLRAGKETYDPGDAFLHALERNRRFTRSWLSGPIEIVGLRQKAVRPPPAPARNPR